jgi:hypothetical protein
MGRQARSSSHVTSDRAFGAGRADASFGEGLRAGGSHLTRLHCQQARRSVRIQNFSHLGHQGYYGEGLL